MHYNFVFAHFIFIFRCWCKVQSTLLCTSFLHFYQNIQKLCYWGNLDKTFFLFTHFSNSEWNAADARERKRPWVVRFVTRARSKTRSIIAVAVVNLHKRTQCTAVKLHLECGYSSTRENNQTHIAAASKLPLLSKHSHSAPATWFRCVRLFVS